MKQVKPRLPWIVLLSTKHPTSSDYLYNSATLQLLDHLQHGARSGGPCGSIFLRQQLQTVDSRTEELIPEVAQTSLSTYEVSNKSSTIIVLCYGHWWPYQRSKLAGLWGLGGGRTVGHASEGSWYNRPVDRFTRQTSLPTNVSTCTCIAHRKVSLFQWSAIKNNTPKQRLFLRGHGSSDIRGQG